MSTKKDTTPKMKLYIEAEFPGVISDEELRGILYEIRASGEVRRAEATYPFAIRDVSDL